MKLAEWYASTGARVAAGLLVVSLPFLGFQMRFSRSSAPFSLPPDISEACAGSNPYIVTSCMHSPDVSGPVSYGETISVAAFQDTASDLPSYVLATQAEVGSVFGLAYASREHALYAAAFNKRQTRFGPGGPGAIYRIDLRSLSVQQAITVPNAGADLHERGPIGSDESAGQWAGKTSLGDIEISPDGTTLFAMNLFDRRIYRFALPDGTLMDSFPSGGVLEPWAEDARPFALAVHDVRLLHGVVNSAESTRQRAELTAHVYRSQLDGGQMQEVLQLDLDYTRGRIRNALLDVSGRLNWMPWNDRDRGLVDPGPGGAPWGPVSIYPMPMLTDIQLAVDGSIILAFRDRNLDRAEVVAGGGVRPPALGAGDLLRGEWDGSTWQLRTARHFDDHSRDADEMAQGGLASIWRTGQIVAGLAPADFSGNIYRAEQDVVRWFDTSSGSTLREERLCERWSETPRLAWLPDTAWDDTPLGFTGTGDLEVLCAGPTEVAPPPTRTVTPSPTPTAPPSPSAGPSDTPTPSPTANPTPSPSPSPSPAPTSEPRPVYLPILLLQPDCARVPVAVALVLDASTSMREATRAGRPKAEAAVEAASSFLDALRLPEDRAAIVAFNADASLLAGLTGDRALLDEALVRVELAQFTRIDLGIEEARRELTSADHEGETRAMIVLTDGRNNPEPVASAVTAAARAKANGIRVFTIGLGREIEESALRQMASEPNDYRAAADGEDLAGIYQALAGAVRACPGQWRP